MASKLNSILITGANRGIGFALLKEILAKFRPKVAFATYRDASKVEELKELAGAHKNLHLIQMDVTNYAKHAEVASFVESLTGAAGLNLLLNNAGVSVNDRIGSITIEMLRTNMETNCFAPILLSQALLPQLEKASSAGAESSGGMGIHRAAIVNFSSVLGSISGNDFGQLYPYRCSKTALNSATKSMSLDFQKKKILAVALHPGWVQTKMGGTNATLTVDQSVDGIMKILMDLNESHNGKFIDWEGKEVGW